MNHFLILLGIALLAATVGLASEASACTLCGDGQGASLTDAIVPLAIAGGGALLVLGARGSQKDGRR